MRRASLAYAALGVAVLAATSCRPMTRRPPAPDRPTRPVTLARPPETPGVLVPPGGVFAWPVAEGEKRIVDSAFGLRTIESLGTAELHDGVDIEAEEGARVVASRQGRVAWVGQRPALGWTVILEHEDRWQTVYANLAPPLVVAGAVVAEGEELARTGSRCDARAGSCLHFEIRREGRAVDPLPLLAGGNGP